MESKFDESDLTAIDDITCDIEDLRFNSEKSSEVAIKNKELLFELLKRGIKDGNSN
jgi:hypothetical protein